MSNTQAPIMIMAGGTGGHVFPALAIADELTRIGEKVIWMGTKNGLEARVVPQHGYNIEWLSVNGLRGKSKLTLLLAPFKLLHAFTQAAQILFKYKPKAVLGMGGFVSGPGGLMSWVLRIPLFVHEQNSVVGLTNQWLARVCKHVFYGFPNPKKQTVSGEYVGNPLRKALLDADKVESHQEVSYRLLIIGGSLGAAQLNKVVPEALKLLNTDKVEVVHQCGEKHVKAAQSAYQDAAYQVEVKPFIEDMTEVYQWADFIICRSGALTVAEVTQMGLASIMVPYPYAVDNHQWFNAELLVNAGAAKRLDDKQLTAQKLADELKQVFLDLNQRSKMAQNSKALAKPNATKAVVEKILQEVKA